MSSAARNASRGSRPAPAKPGQPSRAKPWRREALLLMLIGVTAFVAISLISFHPADPSWFNSGKGGPAHNWGGQTGAYIADFLVQVFGVVAWLLPVALGAWVWQLWRYWFHQHPGRRAAPLGAVAMMLGLSSFLALTWPTGWWPIAGAGAGGILGQEAGALARPFIGVGGSALLFLGLFGPGV
ncbi:DNA translocase FtsK 4TM domain-containing protein, partial [Acidithiobacillus sp. PG05]|uniref:DNA translocase FtsK 4TM domain-containing protein n=1 Tax=Acidithiobacillus sp. PG05 TaxID=2801581 RepID=UPI0019CF4E90